MHGKTRLVCLGELRYRQENLVCFRDGVAFRSLAAAFVLAGVAFKFQGECCLFLSLLVLRLNSVFHFSLYCVCVGLA